MGILKAKVAEVVTIQSFSSSNLLIRNVLMTGLKTLEKLNVVYATFQFQKLVAFLITAH